jgi:hypothetical protein
MADITDIEDIPELPDRRQRMDALLVDCYGREEELSAFDIVLALRRRPSPASQIGGLQAGRTGNAS